MWHLHKPASERRYDTNQGGSKVFQMQSKSSLKTALLLGAATASAMSLTTMAKAQETSVETVVVTGSRIPQVGLYSSSPVTAVSQAEIKNEGTVGVETLLNNP